MGAIMKFITEQDLRDLYKKQPFMDYDLQPEERLTPGARQFLLDRGINLYADDPFRKPERQKTAFSKSINEYAEKAAFEEQLEQKKQIWALQGIRGQLEGIEASLGELLNEHLAQEVSADLDHVINTLSRMICSAKGEDEC